MSHTGNGRVNQSQYIWHKYSPILQNIYQL